MIGLRKIFSEKTSDVNKTVTIKTKTKAEALTLKTKTKAEAYATKTKKNTLVHIQHEIHQWQFTMQYTL